MDKLLKMETAAAEKSFALLEQAQANLDKVGRDQETDEMFLRLSETFSLSLAAVLRRSRRLGVVGPAKATSTRGPGRQVSSVHGEEKGCPKDGEGDGGSGRVVRGDGGQVREILFVLS